MKFRQCALVGEIGESEIAVRGVNAIVIRFRWMLKVIHRHAGNPVIVNDVVLHDSVIGCGTGYIESAAVFEGARAVNRIEEDFRTAGIVGIDAVPILAVKHVVDHFAFGGIADAHTVAAAVELVPPDYRAVSIVKIQLGVSGIGSVEVVILNREISGGIIIIVAIGGIYAAVVAMLEFKSSDSDISDSSQVESITFIITGAGGVDDKGLFAAGSGNTVEGHRVSGTGIIDAAQGYLPVVGSGIYIEDQRPVHPDVVDDADRGDDIGEIVVSAADIETAGGNPARINPGGVQRLAHSR